MTASSIRTGDGVDLLDLLPDVRAKGRRLSCMGDHDAQDSEEINCSFEREVGRVNRKSGAPRPQGIDPQRPESQTVDDEERQSRPSS
jgi:hypothetical protein